MNILVCVKQVPNTKHMSIDPNTHRLVRHGINSILNPADRYVLEKALRFRDQYGGTVTVMTMGAPQAAEILRSAWLVGADRCLLLTDPAFGGSDTFATASVLMAAVRYEQQRSGVPFDLIFCGKSTIDGETGQVGPELAELLGIASFTNIARLEYHGASCRIDYAVDDLKLSVDAALPILVTYPLTSDAVLRSAMPERLEREEELSIFPLTSEELSPWLNRAEIGLGGSATRVVRSFVPPTGRKGVRFDRGTAKEKAARLVKCLIRDGLLLRKTEAADIVSEFRKPAEQDAGRICVFVEQNRKGVCKNVSLELLTPALRMGSSAGLRVSAILVGADNGAAIAELQKYPVDEIVTCEAPAFADFQLHDYVEAVSSVIEAFRPEGLLIGSTDLGKELAARIAGRFRTGLTAECTGIRYDRELGGIIWSRPAYGGKLMADIICREKRPQMGTIREGVFVRPEPTAATPVVIPVAAGTSALAQKVTLLQKSVAVGFAPKGEQDVSMIVGMGRGIRDIDGFDLCCDFADTIGADIGASRGAVELQLLSAQYLVGSNGKTVRPGIYFACGISGSLQHMTGVLDAGCIVAINSDPNAEIHRYADYCLVGDLFEIIPALQAELEAIL